MFTVTHIRKPDPQSPHHSIQHLWGNRPDGTAWNDSLANVISHLKNNPTDSFFTRSPLGTSARIYVVPASQFTREHLRTYVDGTPTDNLLSLPQK